jgi:phosphatidylinositol-bisphosphatase
MDAMDGSRYGNEHEHSREESFEHVQAPTTSTPQSLSRAVYHRRADYTRPQTLRLKVGSWNVAACKDVEKDIGAWFVDGRGVEERLTGLHVTESAGGTHGRDNVESVEAQEQRRRKKQSTLPLNDPPAVIGRDEIDLYALGLQEVVELTSAREYIGGFMTDPGPLNKWKRAMEAALPEGYTLVAEQQLSGLLLLIYASPKLAPSIGSVSSVAVGTGFLGYLGNKGAVATRIVLGETTRLVFVNSHLASGTGAANLDRRCWDVTQIVERIRFEPISRGGILDDKSEGLGDEDFAFWLGDLNFRLAGLPGDDIRRLLMLHTKGEYDITSKTGKKIHKELGTSDDIVVRTRTHDSDDDDSSSTKSHTPSSVFSHPNRHSHSSDETQSSEYLPDPDDFNSDHEDPANDPASLQATINSLLPHDELLQVQKKKLAFHDGWREGPITFLPTYKYDVGSMGLFDSSEKKRAPSWCDRILFRARKDKMAYERRSKEEEEVRKKDQELMKRGVDKAGEEESVLFDYDPETDGDAADVNEINARKAEDVAAEGGDYDEAADGDAYHEESDGDGDGADGAGLDEPLHLDVYTSHQRVLSSDHKPLDAVFTLHYDAVDPALKAKVQAEVARELDRVENEGRPQITVVVDQVQEGHETATGHETEASSMTLHTKGTLPVEGLSGVSFGPIAFLQRKTRGLTIANTGSVPATFAFVKRPTAPGEAELVAPRWLTVRFLSREHDGHGFSVTESSNGESKSGTAKSAIKDGRTDANEEITLHPGDATTILLDACVADLSYVRSLNDALSHLDDVLVLRVRDGRDHFVPVRAQWLQSCFGRSIEELCHVPEGGVRALLPPGPKTRRRKHLRIPIGSHDFEAADAARRSSSEADAGTESGYDTPLHGTGAAEPLSEASLPPASRKPINRGTPVHWSLPRELLKLLQSLEALVERALAERDMDLPDSELPLPSSGWPFEEKTWRLRAETPEREEWRYRVMEALDCDRDLVGAFASREEGEGGGVEAGLGGLVTAREKTEVVAEVLLLFLESLQGGIVSPAAWMKIEENWPPSLPASGKDRDRDSKTARGNGEGEELRARVLDVLGQMEPHCNIALVFLGSVLSKIAGEVAPLPKSHGNANGNGNAGPAPEREKVTSSLRKSLSLRKKAPAAGAALGNGLGAPPPTPEIPGSPAVVTDPTNVAFVAAERSKRRSLERSWAEIFAPLVIPSAAAERDGGGKGSEKERKVEMERRRRVVEGFVRGEA